MKLHNRLMKGEFLSDVDLTFLDCRGLVIYEALILLVEDSGCMECHPLQIKSLGFPLRDEITPDIIVATINALQERGKVILYRNGGGKQFLYLVNFHKHQALRSPAPPDVPLPKWVKFIEPDEKHHRGHYEVLTSKIPDLTSVENRTKLYDGVEVSIPSILFSSNSLPEGESEREEKPDHSTGAGRAKDPASDPLNPWTVLAREFIRYNPSANQYGGVAGNARTLKKDWDGIKTPEELTAQVRMLAKKKITGRSSRQLFDALPGSHDDDYNKGLKPGHPDYIPSVAETEAWIKAEEERYHGTG